MGEKIMAGNKNLKFYVQGTLGKWRKILNLSKVIFWLRFLEKSQWSNQFLLVLRKNCRPNYFKPLPKLKDLMYHLRCKWFCHEKKRILVQILGS